jgi:O-antigen ligase/tetratricopeptide (TPR) repeat protein
MGKRSREKWERRETGMGPEKKEKFNYQFGWEKTCLFVIRWGTYLVLFTPLIVMTQFFFPFVAPKTIFFRIVVEIIFASYLFLLASNPSRWRPKINALTITITLFLGIFILASIAGINFERSFWSTFERMTGIWTMLHLFAFFIVLSSVFKERKDWERILGVSILVGVFLSLYVLRGDEISTRGGGTIGNTSFMGAYLLFSIFFALILFLAKRGGWQIFSGISLAIMLPVLLTSTARGAIISFFGGLFLLTLGYLIFSQRKALKRLALAIILVIIIFGITSAVFQPPFVKEKIETTLTEMKPRLVVWEKGWKGFLERPILGWGPENFNVVFLKYFNPCMFLSECGSEIWFDRAHNIVLDTLVTTGIIGLLSYLAVFVVAILGLLKTIPKIVERRNIFFPLGLAVLLIVYFFQNLLVFDMINSYLMFFLVLGFVYFLTEKKKEPEPAEGKPPNFMLMTSIIVILIFLLWAGNVKPMIANNSLIRTLQTPNPQEVSSYFQKSVDSWMNSYEPREHFAQKMVKVSHQDIPEESKSLFFPLYDLAEKEMKESIQENQLDFRPRLFLGELYFADYRVSGNREKLGLAEDTLKKAIELSKSNQQAYWYLAEVKLAQGKPGEAISLLQKAVDLEPRLGTARWYLAMGYKITGDYQSAKEEIEKLPESDFSWNKDNLQRAIEIYRVLGDDSGLIFLYQKILELEPNNAQYWAYLAASQANLGEWAKAREAAEKVTEINPELAPQVEKFLKNINQ